MPIDTRVIDPATGRGLTLRGEGVLPVYPLEPLASTIRREDVRGRASLALQFSTSAGGTSLAVDGSTTAQVFRIEADDADVRFVKEVRLLHHSSGMKIDSSESRIFGAVGAALTNGLKLTSRQGGLVTEIFVSSVKAIGDYRTYARPPQGVVNDVDAISAGVDYLLVVVELPCPVGLYPGSTDTLEITVQDDLSSLTLFEAYAFGCVAVGGF